MSACLQMQSTFKVSCTGCPFLEPLYMTTLEGRIPFDQTRRVSGCLRTSPAGRRCWPTHALPPSCEASSRAGWTTAAPWQRVLVLVRRARGTASLRRLRALQCLEHPHGSMDPLRLEAQTRSLCISDCAGAAVHDMARDAGLGGSTRGGCGKRRWRRHML